ncbi:hypothetical protein GCM10022243_41270 [Saccharothrix violaceirubra]|uniref:Uncharacterized protein n=1 Tax=Saccharothrix violaceirubra TaxID=413306 RepID=A0A7W7T872_9PSEU|nr:hypothetical protein [Saccharothrix violaceirubra]MBB4968383.1 hypothetical protein [Saccharothrix violaceirubra]
MNDQLPSVMEIRVLLEDLTGRAVDVSPHDSPGWSGKPPVTAVLVCNDMKVGVVVAFELPLAASLGAVLGLIPVGGAEACVEDGELSKMIEDNLFEVCNVLTAVFNKGGGRHVRLHALHSKPSEVPSDITAQLNALGSRLDLTVQVNGYLPGKFSIVVPV